MLLFQKRFQVGLVEGTVSLTFRQWDKARVKPGGRYRVHPIGVVEVDGLTRVRVGELSEDDARQAGFESLAGLLDYLRPKAQGRFDHRTQLWRVALHHAGDGDRVAIAMNERITPEERADLARRLERLDRPHRWTTRTLRLIAQHPRVAASQLARRMKLETAPFKARVVNLKKLGLTQSFEVGYELSPRGRAFLKGR